LELAALAGNISLVQWLVKEKSAVSVGSAKRSGPSLRDLCRQSGHTEIVTLLDSLGGASEGTIDKQERM